MPFVPTWIQNTSPRPIDAIAARDLYMSLGSIAPESIVAELQKLSKSRRPETAAMAVRTLCLLGTTRLLWLRKTSSRSLSFALIGMSCWKTRLHRFNRIDRGWLVFGKVGIVPTVIRVSIIGVCCLDYRKNNWLVALTNYWWSRLQARI